MTKKLYALAMAGLALAACVTTSDAYLPDGSKGYHVTCGGSLFSYGDCIQRAGDVCGSAGYTVIDKNGEAIPFSQTNGYANNYSAGVNSTSGSIVQRDLFIKCK